MTPTPYQEAQRRVTATPEEVAALEEAWRRLNTPPSALERAQGLGYSLAAGVAGTLGGGIEQLGLAGEKATKFINPQAPTPFFSGLRQTGQRVASSAEGLRPEHPEATEGLAPKVAGGVGSLIGFAGPAVAGGGALKAAGYGTKLAAWLAGTGAGVLANAAGGYNEVLAATGDVGAAQAAHDKALAEGKSPAEAATAFSGVLRATGNVDLAWETAVWNGLLIGPTETLGFGKYIPRLVRILSRADRASGGQLSQRLVRAGIATGLNSLEEAGQEGFGALLSNWIAADLTKYDEDRSLWEGVLEEATIAGLATPFLAGPIELLSSSSRPRAPGEPGPREPGSPPSPLTEPTEGGPIGPRAPARVTPEAAEGAAREYLARAGVEVPAGARATVEPATPAEEEVREGFRAIGGEAVYVEVPEGTEAPGPAYYSREARTAVFQTGLPERDLRRRLRLHEMGHHLRVIAQEIVASGRGLGQDLWERLRDEITRLDPEGLQAIERDWREAYEAQGLPEALVAEELVSKYLEESGGLLFEAHSFEELAQHPGLFRTVVEWLVRQLNRLPGVKLASPTRTALLDLRERLAETQLEQGLDPEKIPELARVVREAFQAIEGYRPPPSKAEKPAARQEESREKSIRGPESVPSGARPRPRRVREAGGPVEPARAAAPPAPVAPAPTTETTLTGPQAKRLRQKRNRMQARIDALRRKEAAATERGDWPAWSKAQVAREALELELDRTTRPGRPAVTRRGETMTAAEAAAEAAEPGAFSLAKKLEAGLTPEERKRASRKDVAANLEAAFADIPITPAELRAAARMGEQKRGWYRRAAEALKAIFGEDAGIFVRLLSATSPQTSVQENLRMAARVYRNWLEAGRPTSGPELQRVAAPAIMSTRIRATIKVLSGMDPEGLKVGSFQTNLEGDLGAVTLDVWMSKLMQWHQSRFGRVPDYLGASSFVRNVARSMGWEPGEVQETAWSFFMALINKMGQSKSAKEAIATLTTDDVARVPEFVQGLAEDAPTREALEAAGIDVAAISERAALAPRGDETLASEGVRVPKRLADFAELERPRQKFALAAAVGFGEGAPRGLAFPEYTQLPYEAQERVTREVAHVAALEAAKFVGLEIKGEAHGPGGWRAFPAEPSAVFNITGTENQARDFAAALGYLLQQTSVYTEVLTNRGKNVVVDLTSDTPVDSATMRRFWDALVAADPDLATGYHVIPGGIRIGRTESRAAFQRLVPRFRRALDSAAAQVDVDWNMELRPASTFEVGNNWTENPDGQSYLQRVEARFGRGRGAGLSGRVAVVEQALREALDRERGAGGGRHGTRAAGRVAAAGQEQAGAGAFSLFRQLPRGGLRASATLGRPAGVDIRSARDGGLRAYLSGRRKIVPGEFASAFGDYTEKASRTLEGVVGRDLGGDWLPAAGNAALRSPFVERNQVLVVRNGKVVAASVYSTGAVAMTYAPARPEAIRGIFGRGRFQVGDQVLFIHNHPSGNPEPSGPDLAVVGPINHLLEQFAIENHMPTPGTTHLVVGRDRMAAYNGDRVFARLPIAEAAWPLNLEDRMSGPGDTKRLRATPADGVVGFIGLDGAGRPTGVWGMDAARLLDEGERSAVRRELHEKMAHSGSYSAVAVMDGQERVSADVMPYARNLPGEVVDVRYSGRHGVPYALYEVNAMDVPANRERPVLARAMLGAYPGPRAQQPAGAFSLRTREPSPTALYSPLQRAIESWQPRGTVAQLKAHLRKAAGAATEAAHSGMLERLGEDTAKITREEALKLHEDIALKIGVAYEGEPEYQKYTEPGGEDYQEQLLVLQPSPLKTAAEDAGRRERMDAVGGALSRLEGHMEAGKLIPELVRGVGYLSIWPSAAKLHTLFREKNWHALARLAGEFSRDMRFLAANTSSLEVAKWGEMAEAHFAHVSTQAQILANFQAQNQGYRSRHFPMRRNVLVNLRTKTRQRDPGFYQVHFLEEVQSDWHKSLARNGRSITPDAPFGGNAWVRLAAAQAITDAVEAGAHQIGWTSGAQQFARYPNLRDVFQEVRLEKFNYDTEEATLVAETDNGQTVREDVSVDVEVLEEYVGRELAEELVSKFNTAKHDYEQWDGAAARRGGRTVSIDLVQRRSEIPTPDSIRARRGMERFYDEVLPSVFAKLGKRFGAKPAQDYEMPTGKAWSMPITPAMRAHVQEQGLGLFSLSPEDRRRARQLGNEAFRAGESGEGRAIPFEGRQERALARGVDEMREESGRPQYIPNPESEDEGARILRSARRSAAVRAKLERGEQLDAAETVAAARMVHTRMLAAASAKKGPAKNEAMADAIDLMDQLRESRSRTARALQVMRDAIRSPREALMDAVLEPNWRARKRLEHARARLREAVTKEEKARAKAHLFALMRGEGSVLERVLEALRRAGLDIYRLSDAQLADPEVQARVRDVAAEERATLGDKFIELRHGTMLSGLMTHKANLVGNTAMLGLAQHAQRWTEALVNSVVRDADSATLGELGAFYKGFLGSFRKAGANLLQAWRTERDAWEENLQAAQGREGVKHEAWHGKAIKGAKGRIIRIPLRALQASDSFFKTVAGLSEVSALAYREAKKEGLAGDELVRRMQDIIADPAHEVWVKAHEVAVRLTFQTRPQRGRSFADDMLIHAQRARDLVDEYSFGVGGRMLLPYLNTPFRIFQEGLGLALAPVKLAGKSVVFPKTYKGNRKAFVADSARAMIALAIGTAILNMLWDEDEEGRPLITGTGLPYEARRSAYGYRTVPPYSIQLFGEYRDYRRIEPLAVTLSTLVDMAERIKSDPDPLEASKAFFQSVLEQTGDKTFLQTWGDVYDALSRPEGYAGAKVLRDTLVTPMFPNIVRQTLREQDPYFRVNQLRKQREGATAMLEAASESLLEQALPGPVAGAPPIRYDLWGRPMTRFDPNRNPLGRYVHKLLHPLPAEDMDPYHPLDRVMSRFNERVDMGELPDEKPYYGMSAPRAYTTVGGERVFFDDAQYSEYLRMAGEVAADELMELIERGDIDTENPDRKDMDMFDRALRRGRDKAKARVLQSMGYRRSGKSWLPPSE